MLLALMSYFNRLFQKIQPEYGSELESYIVSKNPQNTYDVEYWTSQYDKKQNERRWMV